MQRLGGAAGSIWGDNETAGGTFALLLFAAACDLRSEFISPPAGTIVDTPTATVTGQVPPSAPAGGTIVVNGVTGTWLGDGSWTAEIPLDTDTYVTPVTAVYTAPNGDHYIQESSLVYGPEINDGQFSPDGVGMLFTNSGLAGLGPVINNLAGGSFDISALILAQDPLIPKTDAGSGETTPWQGGWSGGTFTEPFIGSNAASIQGDTARSVVVEFFFDVTAWSDSHLAFPAEAGTRSPSTSAPSR